MAKAKKVSRILATTTVSLKKPVIPVETKDPRRIFTEYIPFGGDNLFPQFLAEVYRKNRTHRRIIRNKTLNTIGKGFQSENKALLEYFKLVNNKGESMRKVYKKVVQDRYTFGNAYIEIVTNKARTFLNLFHRDATTARVLRPKIVETEKGKVAFAEGFVDSIVFHPEWERISRSGAFGTQSTLDERAQFIPLYPNFIEDNTGNLHSVIHIKEYEPEFTFYGMPSHLAGLDSAVIGFKTMRYNLSRLDNNFQPSAIITILGDMGEDDAKKLKDDLKKEFTGEDSQGNLFVLVGQGEKNLVQVDTLDDNSDGAWKDLDQQAVGAIVEAHEWFRSLAGIPDPTGFDTERILNEYQIALQTVILPEQNLILDEIMTVISNEIGLEDEDVSVRNEFPTLVGSLTADKFIRIWEARKAAGQDFDKEDEEQQKFIDSGTSTTVNVNN